MANVYGFDSSIYPGIETLRWYWETCGFRYAGFYLAPAPNHTDRSWMDHRNALASEGWGFLPVYVGLQIANAHLGEPRGEQDGRQAAALMREAGFPSHTICYLDLEDGTVPRGDYAAYIGSWIRTLRQADFVPGLYCSHRIADWCRKQTPYLWTFRIPARSSGVAYDSRALPQGTIAAGGFVTQFRQNVSVRGNPTQIDLNVSGVPDPSHLPSALQALAVS